MRTTDGLESLLSSLRVDTSLKLRLFVVEDLSREVIEALGHRLKIDPSFFRDHIIDSKWDHFDDESRAPTNLRASILKQSWYTLRYVRARNFPASSILEVGAKAVHNFNIFRRLEDDENSNRFWDTEDRVGLIQSKATMWVQSPSKANDADLDLSNASNPSVAVLILDPSIIEGNPLWRKSRNWTQPPKVDSNLPSASEEIPEDNTFENFVYWAKKPEAFNDLKIDSNLSSTLLPTQILLHIICNQWLTLVDYLKTRLNQIEWELAFPHDALERNERMETFEKLRQWRLKLPLFRDMIQDLGSLEDRVHSILRDGSICDSEHDIAAEPKRDFLGSHSHIYEWENPYQLDILGHADRMAEFDDQIDRLVKLTELTWSMDQSLLTRHIYGRRKTRVFWLGQLWMIGTLPASLCAMTTRPISELVPSLRLWAMIAIPLMLVLVVGKRFFTA